MPFRLCFFLSLFFSAKLRGQENPLPKRLVCPGVDVVSLYRMHGDSLPSYTYVATIRPKGLPFDTLDPKFSYEFRSMGYQKALLSYAQLLALEGKVNLLPKDIELPDYTIVVPSLRLVPNTQEVLAIGRASQERRQPQTMAHWLESAGGIFVQRSQQGGGSPVLRGFEARRILLVVDGIRVNNAIFRSGHLQNVIRLDPHMHPTAELLFGPGNVLYGSDALGGVIHFKSASLIQEDSAYVKGLTAARYSSANTERHMHAMVRYGNKAWAGLTAFSFTEFGDLRQGAVAGGAEPGRWDHRFTVRRVDGKDLIFKSNNPNLQQQSGYGQINLMQKLGRFGKNISHELQFQFSRSSEVPRYDRLTDSTENGAPMYATWNYGPELFAQAAWQSQGVLGSVRFSQTVAWQFAEESRIVRRLNQNLERTQRERVHTASYRLVLKPEEPRRKLMRLLSNAGFELQFNQVDSKAWLRDVDLQTRSQGPSRYPQNGSQMLLAGLWLELAEGAFGTQWSWRIGLRGNFSYLAANFGTNNFFNFPFSVARQDQWALTGSGALRWSKGPHVLRFHLGTGVRSPNVDDLAKVFDTQPGLLVVPNPNLGPERVYSLESSYVWEHKRHRLAFTGFATWVNQLIALEPGTLYGMDSVEFDGINSQVLQQGNQDYGYILGGHALYEMALGRHLGVAGRCNYTFGRMRSASLQSWVPMGHIAPLSGQLAVHYRRPVWEAETWVQVHGQKSAEEYSPFGEDNLRYATPGGMPAWWTLHMRWAWNINAHVRLQLTLENVLDVRYRVFASGISAPGRNVVVSVQGNF